MGLRDDIAKLHAEANGRRDLAPGVNGGLLQFFGPRNVTDSEASLQIKNVKVTRNGDDVAVDFEVTNVDPDQLTYPIPVNDDAIKCIKLICKAVADAAIEGAAERAARLPEIEAQEAAAAAGEAESQQLPSDVQDDLLAAMSATGTLSFSPDEDPPVTPAAGGNPSA